MANRAPHLAKPGPGYWDYRCLVCGEPVENHQTIGGRLVALISDRLPKVRHPAPTPSTKGTD